MRYNIALIAHDNCKKDLVEWVIANREKLRNHNLICTGTTGAAVEKEMNKIDNNAREYIQVRKLKSGPLGGDQQIGAMISEGKIDMMIFFWDPMSQQPHDVDVKALLRITVLYNIPTANCRSTADFLISSSLFENYNYQYKVTHFSYLEGRAS